MDDTDMKALIEHLRELGCSEDEVKQIIGRVRQYDEETLRDSVFDSIEGGTFNIGAIIDEIRKA